MQSNDTSSKPLHQSINAPCNTLRFCSGNSGNVQRRIIRHLLAMIDGGLDHLSPQDRLEVAGTDSVRSVCAPRKNPMEYIRQLRAINGRDCILSVPVDAARISKVGRAPTYYMLPFNTRSAWRSALQKPQHATGAGEAQS